MIIIDSNSQLRNYFKNLSLSSQSIFLDKEVFLVAENNGSEIYCILESLLHDPDVLKKAKNLKNIILFRDVKSVINEKIRFIGVIELDSDRALVKSVLESLEDTFSEKEYLRSELVSINADLNLALSIVEKEMLNIKRIYEQIVPRRVEKLKDIEIRSKYSAGMSSGGEFFDLFIANNKVYLFASSVSNYTLSSSILTHFTYFKKSPHLLPDFIKILEKEIEELNTTSSSKNQVELFLGELDLFSKKLSAHIFGNFNLLSTKFENTCLGNNHALSLENVDKALVEVNLDRGERILLISPGLMKNWNTKTRTLYFEKLLGAKIYDLGHVLDEVYFELKKDLGDGYLDYDATAIILEIDENAMVKMV